MAQISVEEWLAEMERIQQLQAANGEGFTTKELSESSGKSILATRAIITQLIKEGKVQPVSIKRTSILTNFTKLTPGFRLVRQ